MREESDLAQDHSRSSASDAPPGVERRTFLKILAATLAFASATGCSEGGGELVLPFAREVPDVEPGLASTYATSMTVDGLATGLLVTSRAGRPVKIEGNPEHPASLGAAGVLEQASVLSLYDPNRARGMLRGAKPAGWPEARATFSAPRPDGGAGLCFLLEPTSSPLRLSLLDRIRERCPRCRVYFHAPCASTTPAAATRRLFGRPLATQLDLRAAKRVLAVGADFASQGPFHLRYARDLAARKKPRGPGDEISRLYQIESEPSPTGSLADEHLCLKESLLPCTLAALLIELDVPLPGLSQLAARLPEAQRRWVRAAAADLGAHRGACVVIVGGTLPASSHALGALANEVLGGIGTTSWYTEPATAAFDGPQQGLAGLAADVAGGGVDTVAVLEGNPVYAAPPDVDLAAALRAAPASVYLGPYDNETARLCRWRVASRHYLESWGDARAYDGTLSLVQPLIEPLFDGTSVDEVLALFAGSAATDARSLLLDAWAKRAPRADARALAASLWWRELLQRGLLPDSAAPRASARVDRGAVARLVAETPPPLADTIEVVLRPDRKVYDGRFTGNAWLLELPDPVTKLTWGNAAVLSPHTARHLEVETGDVVEIATHERAVRIPAFVLDDHADDCISVPLGYGRGAEAEPGAGVGVDASVLRTGAAPFLVPEVSIHPVVESGARVRRALAWTQHHQGMAGRPIVLEATADEWRAAPDFPSEHRGAVDTLYGPIAGGSPEQWAMTIDLAACTGCSACVVACQAENNIPVVGADGVRRGRIMQWLRIDRYRLDESPGARVAHQPMLCQHCEMAPCEYVCPVNATVHSSDGLNDMIYNRCVGTRFCSNNCPYKVRRFNWLDYSARRSELESLVLNPEVTVRERGVMEKCSYCVQRLRATQIRARIERRPVRDGEVQTACQQSCPTRAIVFGSIADPTSEVTRSRLNPRMYEVLHDLGTKPRTRYLARIRNPNPDVVEKT